MNRMKQILEGNDIELLLNEDKVSVEKRILFYYQAQKSYLLSQMLI